MTITRSNWTYFLSMFFYYCLNSNLTHIKTTIRILHYIKETLHYNVHYNEKNNLINYIDVDFVKIVNDCRFTND